VTISEGVSVTVRYKFYASGVMTENALDDISTYPGTSGGQLLRRVSSTLDFTRDNYAATEIRSDRQEVDFRLGTGSVTGDISGEYSGGTYWDFINATHRATAVSSVTLTQADFTSIAASASGSSLTLATGDAVALGLFVGDVIRLSGSSVAANDAVNFTILSFTSTNTVIHVTPAPTDMGADTTITLTRPGKSSMIPSTSHVSRKVAIEHYSEDNDYSRLFVESRVSKYVLTMPATGLVTIALTLNGRWQYDIGSTSSPYFTNPAAETSSGIMAAVNGLLLINGSSVGVVTGVTLTNEMAADIGKVVGQNFAAAIALGHNMVTGQVTAYLNGSLIPALFSAETEVGLLIGLDANSTSNTPTTKIYLPRIKFTGAQVPATGEGLQTITAPFRALKYTGSAAGVPVTTVRIVDTEAA